MLLVKYNAELQLTPTIKRIWKTHSEAPQGQLRQSRSEYEKKQPLEVAGASGGISLELGSLPRNTNGHDTF